MQRIRVALALAATLVLAACNQGGGGAAGALPDDMALGNPQAKVTVVEYASVGCPICARCRQRSHWFIAKVILCAHVAAGLFRLIYDWLR